MMALKFRVVVYRIRLFPTLISKKSLRYEPPLTIPNPSYTSSKPICLKSLLQIINFRVGNHQNQFLYVLDNRRLPNSWGNGPADSFLYLGLNQVVYTATTEKRGTGLCRACVTIQRKCPKASMELDLKNGQIWGSHDKIKIKSDMTSQFYPEYPCSRQAVTEIFTMDLKSVEFELFYEGQGP